MLGRLRHCGLGVPSIGGGFCYYCSGWGRGLLPRRAESTELLVLGMTGSGKVGTVKSVL